MTDAGYTISGDALSRPKLEAAHLAEHLSIEADRLGGAVRDGVDAAQAARETCGSLVPGTCASMIRISMPHNSDLGDHLLALMEAETPADALRIDLELAQRQASSAQRRHYDVHGLKPSPAGRGAGARARA